MHQFKSTVKAATVHAYAAHLLRQALEMEKYRPSIPFAPVVAVLLLAACWQTSLTAACGLVKDKPSHRHVRQVLYAHLPPRPSELLARLLRSLRQTLPDHLGRVPRVMALDLHQRPYYGKKNTKGCTLRKKKASTKKSFTYATLAVLDPCGCFTVGFLLTRPHMRLTTIVQTLLEQAAAAGLSVSYLMMDREFYSAEVVALLQKLEVPFLMPAVCKGNKGKGNSYLFDPAKPVGWYDYTWTTQPRRMDFKAKKRKKKGTLTVQVRMCVVRHQKSGEPVVFAAWGLGQWPPAVVVQAYRRRFGIETRYRQMGQCLARTSSRCERLRLLLVGLALLLCNLWSLLHSEVFSTGAVGERQLHLHQMRLAHLIAAVAAHIASLLGGLIDEWTSQRPPPHCLAPFMT